MGKTSSQQWRLQTAERESVGLTELAIGNQGWMHIHKCSADEDSSLGQASRTPADHGLARGRASCRGDENPSGSPCNLRFKNRGPGWRQFARATCRDRSPARGFKNTSGFRHRLRGRGALLSSILYISEPQAPSSRQTCKPTNPVRAAGRVHDKKSDLNKHFWSWFVI